MNKYKLKFNVDKSKWEIALLEASERALKTVYWPSINKSNKYG